jgi:HEPN domain-containing protein
LLVSSLVDDERIAPEILAFHAQQAVEKGLKALLIQRQIEFPRTHDVRLLVRLCQTSGYPSVDILVETGSLSRYAVTTRYPGEAEPVSRAEAREAAEIAAQTIAWIETQLEDS